MGGKLGSDLETVVAGALGIEVAGVSNGLAYGDIAEWDSLRHLNLMLALEDRFGLTIDEGAASRLVSVGAIRAFLSDPDRTSPIETAEDPVHDDLTNPELDGVTLARTEVSEIDREGGRLRYRGYEVGELAATSSYEEVAHCLLYGDLPSASQLGEFDGWLTSERALPPTLMSVLETFAEEPLDRALVACLARDSAWTGAETFEELAVAAIARLPTIVAAHAALRRGSALPDPDPNLGHAANAFLMIRGKAPTGPEAAALNAAFVTQAEHGLAASTLAARVAIGANADVRSALTAAVGAWFGNLHAGAVVEAMRVHATIDDEDSARRLARMWRGGEGKPYGFGHRVYRGADPRSEALRNVAVRLSDALADPQPLAQADLLVAAVTEEWRGTLHPNFDSYAAVVYRLLGVEEAQAVGLFACARIAGWLAHISEQLANNHLIRPRLQFTGATARKVPGRDR